MSLNKKGCWKSWQNGQAFLCRLLLLLISHEIISSSCFLHSFCMLVCRGGSFQLQGLFVKIIVGQEEHLVAILLALPYTQNKTQKKSLKKKEVCFQLAVLF